MKNITKPIDLQYIRLNCIAMMLKTLLILSYLVMLGGCATRPVVCSQLHRSENAAQIHHEKKGELKVIYQNKLHRLKFLKREKSLRLNHSAYSLLIHWDDQSIRWKDSLGQSGKTSIHDKKVKIKGVGSMPMDAFWGIMHHMSHHEKVRMNLDSLKKGTYMPSKTMLDMTEGHRIFRHRLMKSETEQNWFKQLIDFGQNPKVLVIACSDSRVDPAYILNCRPGDLFVVRNVANLVPSYEPDDGYHGTSAALEFAVRHLGVESIIVLGHTDCGGIGSLFQKNDHPSSTFISKWMKLARSSYQETKDHAGHQTVEKQISYCEQRSIVHSLDRLMTFPWIREKVEAGKLEIHGWQLDLDKVQLKAYDPQRKEFVDLLDLSNQGAPKRSDL